MEIAVIGVGHTAFGELWTDSLLDLIVRAQSEALADAGLEPNQIDEIFVANMCAPQLSGQAHLGALAADMLGVSAAGCTIEAACASGSFAVRSAIRSILSGESTVVMVTGAEKLMDSSVELVAESFMSASVRDVEHAKGATFPSLFALVARLYLEKYKITREQLAQVSIKNHAHGAKNPLAHFQREITLEDFTLAPMIADPLTLLDCSPVSDGAASVLLSSVDFAKKLQRPFVRIIACEAAMDCMNIAERENIINLKATTLAAKKAFARAGISHKDINVLEVHDAFSPAELMALEALGFFREGQAAAATVEGITASTGSLPVNVSGGLKAKGHPVGATGIAQIVELTKQLRGDAGIRQLNNPRYALAHNMGGIGTSVVVTILTQSS
ncbi:thiolase domain-containing protein [Candidatus Dependentiae bacterium]|nr:thiolase domain-containing protein [Candidatus Dependentiae bacterium]